MGVGIVLAGGGGRRLGGQKATALLAGRPLIRHVVDAVRAGGLEPVVVVKADTALPELDCRIVIEPDAPRHPLTGIVAGLRAIGAPGAVVCPTDMPFLTGELLAWLEGVTEPLAVVRAGGRVQPLLGRYAVTLLGVLERELAREPPMGELVALLGARVVEEDELRAFGDPARMLVNINTAAELARAGG